MIDGNGEPGRSGRPLRPAADDGQQAALAAIAQQLVGRSPEGIAMAIAQIIRNGHLSAGDRLPTVRAVADHLTVSPSTVSEAWRQLQHRGLVETHRRRGTFVRSSRDPTVPGRFWQVPVDPGTFAMDLSMGTPDPDLLPPLGPILARAHLDLPVTSYLDEPVLDVLEDELRRTWPFPPERLTILDGALDALDRLIMATVALGDRVLVSDPAFPPMLDMLEGAGARIVGLPLDDEGIVPDALREALDLSPKVLILQSRAHNPTGVSMTARRAEDLAQIIGSADRRMRDDPLLVIEDDHSAGVSGAPLASIGSWLPDQVVHVRSFSKSHGPDLRLAAVAGSAAVVDAVVRRRRLGPSWTSRLLQHLLYTMLIDPETITMVARASDAYVERSDLLRRSLERAGVSVGSSTGLNLWCPVADEQMALVTLAAAGIGAAPGSPFCVTPSRQQHLRLSIAEITGDYDRIAGLIARAADARPGH